MKQRVRFIINPISGVKKKADIPTLIEKKIDKSKYDYDISYTEYRKHAKQIAIDSAKEGVDIVCAVGGDGSVHEVGTALIGTKTKLAIIPTGSGNGLARHLNIPLTIEGAIELINSHQVIKMDTVVVNDKPFLGVGGYGFDALIAKRFNEQHIRGFSKYIKLVIKEYMKYKPTEVEFELDGVRRKESVVLCTVANASEFGNGFAVSPESSVLDGKIELCLLKPFSVFSAPSIAYNFFNKRAHRSKYTEIIPFQKARMFLTNKMAHYDGEPFDVREELNIEVVPKSLYILAGKEN